jgi:hypothetical protein
MTTTRHYSEADLLETYYTQPGESMQVMLHLAGCTECAARYERLERKLHAAASCHSEAERPETFWSRQRHTIVRSIAARRDRGAAADRVWRTAAAAVLAFVLGGAVVYETLAPELNAPHTSTIAEHQRPPRRQETVTPPSAEESVAHDPWQSDELRDFHGVVAWESWEDTKATPGDQSL